MSWRNTNAPINEEFIKPRLITITVNESTKGILFYLAVKDIFVSPTGLRLTEFKNTYLRKV